MSSRTGSCLEPKPEFQRSISLNFLKTFRNGLVTIPQRLRNSTLRLKRLRLKRQRHKPPPRNLPLPRRNSRHRSHWRTCTQSVKLKVINQVFLINPSYWRGRLTSPTITTTATQERKGLTSPLRLLTAVHIVVMRIWNAKKLASFASSC